MLNSLLIFLGGGLGSLARHGLSGLVPQEANAFPWGTLLVNVTGSLAIGLFGTLTGPEGRWLTPAAGRTFFMVGLCGGYTTFSAFSLQTLELARGGYWGKAGMYCVLSMVLCLVAVWAGHALASVWSAKHS